MLSIFKRTKIKNWEIELLKKVISQMPKNYSNSLITQINDGLLKGVIIGVSDIPGFVAFTYNYEVLKKYDDEKEPDYKLSNIKVFDKRSLSYIHYEIYVSSGTINGYSIKTKKNLNFDLNRIDTSGLVKVYIGCLDYERMTNILSDEEKKVINPTCVYSVLIDDKEYFHIKDLEDGDFIGIDIYKNIYKITHDPFMILKIQGCIVDFFK